MFRNISALCSLIIFLLFSGCSDSGIETITLNEIQIGALIPQTGDFASGGAGLLSALNCAVEDVNSYFESKNKGTRIKLVYSDTETDSSVARAIVESFIAHNIRITIGPSTSLEVFGVKDQINSSNNILISPSSTLPSLAIENDNIYRVVPNDEKTAEATVEVMWQQGIRNLAMFYVDNGWGEAFKSLVKEKFIAKGGTYIGDQSFIGSRSSELSEYLDELSAIINPYISSIDPSTIAVQMISLDVGALLLDLASADSTFSLIKWYGCDGFVNTDELFYYEDGSKFAYDVGFTSLIFGSPQTGELLAVADRINSATDSPVSQYLLLAYDALFVAAKVLDEVGEDVSLQLLKEKLESTFATHQGITGNIIFNDAGDRENGSYYFWKIMKEGNTYKWEHVLSYTNRVIE